MKAVLQEAGIDFEKIHDLDVLLEKCKNFASGLEGHKKELIELSSFAVEIRYPGVRAKKREADDCISVMRMARKIMRENLL